MTAASDLPPEWAQALLDAGLVDPRRKEAVPSLTQLATRVNLAVETVRRMVHGIGEAKDANVKAVADVLGDDVYTWVRRAQQNSTPWTAPPEAAFLTEEEGQLVSQLIRQLTAHRRTTQVFSTSGSGKTESFVNSLAALSQREGIEAAARKSLADIVQFAGSEMVVSLASEYADDDESAPDLDQLAARRPARSRKLSDS